MGGNRREASPFSFERVAFTVPEFCFRNGISRPTYHRLRAQGRGPVEMRLGLNAIRTSGDDPASSLWLPTRWPPFLGGGSP